MTMFHRIGLIFICTVLSLSSLFAQSTNGLKQIKENGKSYYLYTVGPAEGFYSIARKFDISKQEVIQYNPETKNGLKLGQTIKFPVVFVAPATPITSGSQVDSLTTHLVIAGETVYSIAKNSNVGINQIYALNPKARNGIAIGELLRLPTPPPEATSLSLTSEPIIQTNTVSATTIPKSAIYSSIPVEKGFQTHLVQAQETLYMLSKEYQVGIDDLIEANPALKSTALQAGMVIRIPKKIDGPQVTVLTKGEAPKDEFFYHTVAPKEGLYGISKYYNIPQDSIKLLNPNINFEQLPIGTKVKLPVTAYNDSLIAKPKEYMYYTTEKRVSLERIADMFNTNTTVLKQLNPGYVRGKINKNVVVRVPLQGSWQNASSLIHVEPVVDTVALTQEQKSVAIVEPSSEKLSEINIAVLLPMMLQDTSVAAALATSKKYVEFYAGILLSVKQLEKQGIKVNVTCYDTNKSGATLSRILTNPELKKANLIVGPVYSSQVAIMSKFALNNQIMTVIPFSSRSNIVSENPYLIQINTEEQSTFTPITAKVLAQKFNTGNIILIDPNTYKSKGVNPFVTALNAAVNEQKKYVSSTVTIHTISVGSVPSLKTYLNRNTSNYIVFPSSNKADVARTLPQIKTALSEVKDVDIQLIGFPEWQSMKNIDQNELHQYRFTTFAPLFEDFSNPKVIEFLQAYREEYNTEPTASYPCYGLYGYDIANYFCIAINKYGKNFQDHLSEVDFEQVGSNFSFHRAALWSGFMNDGYLMIQYTPDFRISVIDKVSAQ